MTPDLLALDLATLRTFRLVYRLGSFSEAAAQIDVKQSTVSYTIDRMRKVTGDPLFVRQGGGIAPTDRAKDLLQVVERILSEADNFTSEAEFDPATFGGEITIGCALYGSHVIIPKLLQRLRKDSPNLSVNVRTNFYEFVDPLLAGEIDLAILTTSYEGKGVYSEALVDDDFDVCVMDPTNPLNGKRLTLEHLGAAKHVRALQFRLFKHPYLEELRKRGVRTDEPVVINSAIDIPRIVAGTDLISALPSRIAREYGHSLALAELPFKARAGANMFWSAAANRSKMNIWLRGVIRDVVATLGPPMQLDP